jgi:hypothetical protein
MAKKNISENSTKKIFGYYSYSLKQGSGKPVIWNCSECFSEQVKKYRYAIKNSLCLKCSNKKNANTNIRQRIDKLKKWHEKNEHPLSGTKRPQHVVDALKKANTGRIKTIKEREYRSKLFGGKNNPMYGKKHSKKSLKKMKDFQKINPAIRGKNSNFYGKKPFHGKGDWYICKDGSKAWMRSSWELKFAKYLDDNNIEWLYEPKSFPITYNGKEGTYSPDFFLINENYYIEIKGWWRDDSYIKYNVFLKQYPDLDIKLYDKNKLKQFLIL